MNEQQIEELKQDFIDYKTKAERVIETAKAGLVVTGLVLGLELSEAEN